MLMRHSVRPPTKDHPTPKGTTAQPWPAWSTPIGELTPHGEEGARLMGIYNRQLLATRGLLPANGCLGDAVSVWASGKSRAIKTAKSFVDGLAPGCGTTVSFPATENDDPVFHPLNSGAKIDGTLAKSASLRRAPKGKLEEEIVAHNEEFKVLQRVMDCCAPPVCSKNAAKEGCTIADLSSEIISGEEGKPALEGGLGMASTAAQTFLLEYVEGKPIAEVGWGRATKADIQKMLRFHTTKFFYEVRSPYVAERYAAPIAKRIVEALGEKSNKARLTLLAGHDTNVAALGGYFDLHWVPADYPPDSLPPGGALGFELLSNGKGETYVRAFFQTQSMDQLRNLTPLNQANPPAQVYIPIPGCGEKHDPTLCNFKTFQNIVNRKLTNPAKS